ncbi:nitroreductase family deazaflavin-dependent oxidoreductase [Jatrophihabitans telluris]
MVPIDRAVQRRSRGRLSILGADVLPELLLTTTGRSTGRRRTVALLYAVAAEPDDYVVVASNWGQPHHPAWSANLLAQPRATVELRGREQVVQARLAEGTERDQVWPRVLEIWPAYATYSARSGRTLRVFLLRVIRP